VRKRTAVLLAVVLLAGCSVPTKGMAFDTDGRSYPGYVEPGHYKDEGLRKVRPVSNVVLASSPTEVVAQTICQVLSREDWSKVLGGGEVGRQILDNAGVGYAQCLVQSDRALLRFYAGPGFQPNLAKDFKPHAPDDRVDELTIGGRKVKVALAAKAPYGAHIWFALDEEAERPDVKPVVGRNNAVSLEVDPGYLAREDRQTATQHLIVNVLERIIPPLSRDGVAVPDVDDKGNVAFGETPMDNVLDNTGPLRALMLCTAALHGLGLDQTSTDVQAANSGECSLRPKTGGTGSATMLTIEPDKMDPAPTDTVAGHKARTSEAKAFQVLMRDAPPVWLTIRGDNLKPIAEKVVPLLVS
jgi:hypothetical protein